MTVKIDQFYDIHAKKTKFKVHCARCNRGYPEGINPVNAERHATRKGFNADTGLCKLCTLQTVNTTEEAGVGQS